MRLFVLVRHGQSELNATRRVNGDPAVAVGLTAEGESEAAGLALQLGQIAEQGLVTGEPPAAEEAPPAEEAPAEGEEKAE